MGSKAEVKAVEKSAQENQSRMMLEDLIPDTATDVKEQPGEA